MLSRTRRTALAAVLMLLALAPAANAASKPRFTRIAGFKSPGTPAKYNKVGILATGKSSAKNVLVLNPGTSASAAYFEPLAKDIVKRAPSWQVWAVERRENLLEDQSMLDKVKNGSATSKQAFDYYLGWLADSSITPHFQFIPDSTVGYAKQWGMNTEMEDLNRVVARAKKLGGKVVVGGHSLGGSMTTAYATWDFKGKPGATGLSGLVFIDGGSGPTPESAADAQKALDNLDDSKTSPWLTFGGIAAPYTGLFNSTGALGAITDPNSPSVGQAFPLLPANLKPPVPVTNLGQYGYALDNDTSPASLAAAQGHIGHLDPDGNPHGWVDDEITPIKRFAEMFAGWGLKGLDGTAWYHPMKLTIDSAVVAAGNKNAGQKILDVHATHGKDLPKTMRMYAFGAALGGTRVLDATKALAKQSGIPSKNLVLIDRHTTYSHNDPNSASPKNDFVKNLIPFLKKIAK
jgi:pimeloyl-ACP methyl ester carboxylesterase